MQTTIANHRGKLSSTYEFKKDKGNSKSSSSPPKTSTKEAITISTKEHVRISGKSRPEGKKVLFLKETTKKRPTLKELQEKKYAFHNSNLSGISNDPFENKIIELLVTKQPEEAGRTNDSNYSRYHKVISLPLEKCITLKERIMQLAKDGKIILDLDDTAEAHYICAPLESSCPLREGHVLPHQGYRYSLFSLEA